MELVASITAAPSEWTPERSATLSAWLQKNAVTAALLDAEPTGDLAKATTIPGARSTALITLLGEITNPAVVMEANLARLAELFQR